MNAAVWVDRHHYHRYQCHRLIILTGIASRIFTWRHPCNTFSVYNFLPLGLFAQYELSSLPCSLIKISFIVTKSMVLWFGHVPSGVVCNCWRWALIQGSDWSVDSGGVQYPSFQHLWVRVSRRGRVGTRRRQRRPRKLSGRWGLTQVSVEEKTEGGMWTEHITYHHFCIKSLLLEPL